MSKSVSSKSEKVRNTLNFDRSEKDPCYMGQVVTKLKEHPNYAKLPLTQIKQESRKLTDTQQMKEYFSKYLLDVQMSDLQVRGEDTPGASINEASADHSPGASVVVSPASLASLPVKLHLTALPCDRQIENEYASMLEERYGPMHAALQIGDTIIEWSSHSVVVPHGNVPQEPLIKADITQSLKIASELREKAKEYRASRTRNITGEIDLMFEISKSVYSMIEAVIQVIVTWNRYKHFHPFSVNSQHFIQNIFAVLGIEELPFLNASFSDYINNLKEDFRRATNNSSFTCHADLDNYVQQRLGEMGTGEMEYLLTEYYRFHLVGRTAAVHMPEGGEWICKESNCLMNRLESAIAGKELLIASLRPVQ